MEMIKDELIKEGVNEEYIIYIDLDSGKYRKIKTDNEFEEVVDEIFCATLKRYIDELVSAKNLYQCNCFDMKSKKALR